MRLVEVVQTSYTAMLNHLICLARISMRDQMPLFARDPAYLLSSEPLLPLLLVELLFCRNITPCEDASARHYSGGA
jgi:hypothetical protein